jgi:AmmeMemoRadiSam system protein B
MPSPIEGRPGLLLRDPFGYTTAVLVIPPPWVLVLQFLDGSHTELDAQALLTRLAGGEIVPRERVRELVEVLNEAGFLQTEEFLALKEERHEAFRKAVLREPSHAGTAYPDSGPALENRFSEHFTRPPDGAAPLPRALAAPHVSPEGGFASYRAAYDVSADGLEPTFVILGTSHYGPPERFGMTRKAFRTPLGTVEVDRELHDRLVERAKGAVIEEDYCHAPEHSIEFQVVFLRYRLKRPFRILPILCGPFIESLRSGRPPESVESNRRFFAALEELATSRPDLVWILGVDLAHVGRRYGDSEDARANEGRMTEVASADEARLERVCEADADGFFALVHPEGDSLNWCGYSPLYTFLRAVAPVHRLRGKLLRYEQWNIDPASVVSFAAMHFEPAT